jgi:hypothetical protein
MFYSIPNPLCGLSNSIVVLQTAARSFLEATLKTVNSGSPVSFPETRDEGAKLFAGIKPSPDHMHWSVNRVYLINSLRSLFLTAPRFEYNFLFVLAAGGSHLFKLVTSRRCVIERHIHSFMFRAVRSAIVGRSYSSRTSAGEALRTAYRSRDS